jgi:hypothetical protein
MSAPQLLGAAGLVVTAVAIHAGWQSPVQQKVPADWRARFSAAALQIPFDSERAPVPYNGAHGAYPKGAPKMTIAAVKGASDSGKVGRVAFRITSEGAYPGLGIAPGVNYVWQDVKNGKTRQFVIPADTTLPERSLVVTAHKHKAPLPKWPRLLVVELEAPAAMTLSGAQPSPMLKLATCGHCGTSGTWCTAGDTTPHRVMMDVTTLELIKSYYARNKVAWASR